MSGEKKVSGTVFLDMGCQSGKFRVWEDLNEQQPSGNKKRGRESFRQIGMTAIAPILTDFRWVARHAEHARIKARGDGSRPDPFDSGPPKPRKSTPASSQNQTEYIPSETAFFPLLASENRQSKCLYIADRIGAGAKPTNQRKTPIITYFD